MTTDMNIEQEIAAFEAWFTKTKAYISDPKDIFAQIVRDTAWEAWQAGIEHAETRMNRAGRSDSGIDLPPLPEAEIDDAGAFMSDAQVMSIDSAKEYARVAVEHDRKRNDNWRHAVMCAISHNDYETDAPRRVQQALRLLSDAFHGLPFRESIVDDLIADRQRRGEPTAAEISDVIREITGCPDIKNGEDSLVVALGMLFHRCATTQSSEPTIDAPAQVGNVRFGKGVKQSTVIAAAQRHHAYMNTPEKERERIRKGAEFLNELRDLYTAPQPAEPVKVPPATAYCQHPHCQTTGGCQGPCSKKQAEPVKLECPKCGADRSKVPCAGELMNCHFKGEAQPAAPVGEVLGETCIDGGKCHHGCKERCFRRQCCDPFSDYSGPWEYAAETIYPQPAEPVDQHFDESLSSFKEDGLDLEVDDYVRCITCDYVGLVRAGADECPECGKETLMDEPKPDDQVDGPVGIIRADDQPDGETPQQDDRAYEALRAVLRIVLAYLPPNGLTAEQAINKIISVVDPWPLGDHSEEDKA